MNLKNIAYENGLIVLFTGLLDHAEALQIMSEVKKIDSLKNGLKASGAGFVSIGDDGSLESFGKSMSIDIDNAKFSMPLSDITHITPISENYFALSNQKINAFSVSVNDLEVIQSEETPFSPGRNKLTSSNPEHFIANALESFAFT